jgi:hypothetical protein
VDWPGTERPRAEPVIATEGTLGGAIAGAAIGPEVVDAIVGGAMAGAMMAGADAWLGTDAAGSFGTAAGCSDSGRVLVVTPVGGARLSVTMEPWAKAWLKVAAESKASRSIRAACDVSSRFHTFLIADMASRRISAYAKARSTTPAPISPIAAT